jgi:hypothetical protein
LTLRESGRVDFLELLRLHDGVASRTCPVPASRSLHDRTRVFPTMIFRCQ